MKLCAVFDAIYVVEIDVPDGTPEDEFDDIANDYLAEHFCEIAEGIDDSDIDVNEVYVYE